VRAFLCSQPLMAGMVYIMKTLWPWIAPFPSLLRNHQLGQALSRDIVLHRVCMQPEQKQPAADRLHSTPSYAVCW
jgi:hypothetical protein